MPLVCGVDPIVEPADGGDELFSAAPPEVSELPAGGIVAALDASGNTVPAVGGVDDDEVSAKPRAAWRSKAALTKISRLTWAVPPRREPLGAFPGRATRRERGKKLIEALEHVVCHLGSRQAKMWIELRSAPSIVCKRRRLEVISKSDVRAL